MSKRLVVLFILMTIGTWTNATPQDVISRFGQYMSDWCRTDEVLYRDKIESLCSGTKSCRVEDQIHSDYQRQRGYMNYGTFVLDSYLNMFQTLISSGLRFSLSNIVVETQDTYPDGQTLTFITADVKVSGKINYNVKDLFLVRDNKISGIYNYSSIYGFKHLNSKLINALKQNNYQPNEFIENGLIVSKGINKYGLINLKGDLIIPCEWDIILHEDHFAMGARNTTGRVVGYEWGWWDESSAVYDLRNGNKTPFDGIHFEQDHSLYHSGMGRFQILKDVFTEGYAVVYKIIDGKYKYGYLKENDLTYNVRYIYDEASYFQEGYAKVQIGNKSILVDKNLNAVLTLNETYEFGDELYFNNNQIIVYNTRTRKKGVIDINGEWIIKSDKYYIIEPLSCGLARVNLEAPINDGKYGFINAKGDLIIPCIYEDAYRFINSLCLVSKYGHYDYEIIDKYGNSLLDKMKLEFHEPSKRDDELWNKNIIILENTEGKWAVLNNKGIPYPGFNWVHDRLEYVNDNIIKFEIAGKAGLMNLDGQTILKPIYDTIISFESGYSCVGKITNNEKKYGFINEYGILIVPCEYDEHFEYINGIALVKKGNKNGIIDMYGNSYFW